MCSDSLLLLPINFPGVAVQLICFPQRTCERSHVQIGSTLVFSALFEFIFINPCLSMDCPVLCGTMSFEGKLLLLVVLHFAMCSSQYPIKGPTSQAISSSFFVKTPTKDISE